MQRLKQRERFGRAEEGQAVDAANQEWTEGRGYSRARPCTQEVAEPWSRTTYESHTLHLPGEISRLIERGTGQLEHSHHVDLRPGSAELAQSGREEWVVPVEHARDDGINRLVTSQPHQTVAVGQLQDSGGATDLSDKPPALQFVVDNQGDP
jgi:hypothetical protein